MEIARLVQPCTMLQWLFLGINITERHEHGRSVDYIEKGKDATVSYNTLDLKFVNNTGNDIKLYAWCDDVNVCAKITQITYE